MNVSVATYKQLRKGGLSRIQILQQYPKIYRGVQKQLGEHFSSPYNTEGGTIPTTSRKHPSTRRKFGSVKPRVLFTRNIGTSPVTFPKKETNNKKVGTSPKNEKSLNTRYKQLKEKLKAIQNLASNRSRRSENNARELRQLIKSQQNNLLRQIRQRNMSMHRYSRIRGYPTNYYSPNTFSRYYRMPPVHRGLSQYYYYERPGVPRYIQQLPAQVWRINQGGRGLPPVPFYPTRRQARRARR
jgi:hypothetical protein